MMLDTNTSESIAEHEVRSELARVLQSPLFVQSGRLGRFLRFTIDKALAGEGDSLKEYVIGTEVYDRKPSYHPSQDSIVRTEARRLRAKLKEYYDSEGKDDSVYIYFRPGTYSPVFRKNKQSPDLSLQQTVVEGDLLASGAGVSLAVFPFKDLSDRPLSRMCAVGITDEVTFALAHTDGLKVVSRASISQLAATTWDIPALMEKLGVMNVIEGTVREEGDRLLITFRVLNSDGFESGSHRIETVANQDALFQVQRQIATAFISRVRPEQSFIRKRRATAGALSLAVYPLVVKAETLLDEGSASDIQEALSKFQEATQLAPDFARSYCGIAQCYIEKALRGTTPSSSAISLAKSAALRAVELDPGMIQSYASLACTQALEWAWADAEKNFLHALDIGMHVIASRQYALFLASMQRFDEAAHRLEMAQVIDPFSYRQKVARAKFLHITRRYDEGVRQLSEPAIYGPHPVETRLLVSLMLTHLGEKERAKQLIEGIRPASGTQIPMMAGIAEVLALSGDADQAKYIIDCFKLFSEASPVSSFRRSLLALSLGDKERCLSYLTKAVEDREAELVWIGVEPRFDPVRKDPLFKKLVQKVLPDFVCRVGDPNPTH
jgi:TolB-like protein